MNPHLAGFITFCGALTTIVVTIGFFDVNMIRRNQLENRKLYLITYELGNPNQNPLSLKELIYNEIDNINQELKWRCRF